MRAAVLLLVVVAGGGGLLAEAVGVATGVPFGRLRLRRQRSGRRVLGVPLVIPLAWVMMAWPAYLVGGRGWPGARPPGSRSRRRRWRPGTCSSTRRWSTPGTGAGPTPHPALPGVPGVPLTNYAGWARWSRCC